MVPHPPKYKIKKTHWKVQSAAVWVRCGRRWHLRERPLRPDPAALITAPPPAGRHLTQPARHQGRHRPLMRAGVAARAARGRGRAARAARLTSSQLAPTWLWSGRSEAAPCVTRRAARLTPPRAARAAHSLLSGVPLVSVSAPTGPWLGLGLTSWFLTCSPRHWLILPTQSDPPIRQDLTPRGLHLTPRTQWYFLIELHTTTYVLNHC